MDEYSTLRKFLSITITELWQNFSFLKYGIAFAIILVTCFINYYAGVHLWLKGAPFLFSLPWFFFLFIIFLLAGLLIEGETRFFKNKILLFLLLAATLLFALKVTIPFANLLPGETGSSYKQAFQQPISWLGGVLFISVALWFIYRFLEGKWGLYGTKKTSSFSPYLLLIVLMIPLLLWASLQHDFSLVYPKAQVISQTLGTAARPWHYILFETSYASDFITIELFFRGFLVIALSKWLGRKCILPIALFYFSIHLGKPVFEAISSFFGGIILGTISYQNKSIWGGWLVHVSIALLMELFGFAF